jgi:hypothetical protein
MPGTRRRPSIRTPGPTITDRAVDLYERGVRLAARKPSPEGDSALADLCSELSCELGQMPWDADVLTDVDTATPPSFLRTESERDSWYKGRALRLLLVSELNRRRKAERASRKAELEARKAEREAKRAKEATSEPTESAPTSGGPDLGSGPQAPSAR